MRQAGGLELLPLLRHLVFSCPTTCCHTALVFYYYTCLLHSMPSLCLHCASPSSWTSLHTHTPYPTFPHPISLTIPHLYQAARVMPCGQDRMQHERLNFALFPPTLPLPTRTQTPRLAGLDLQTRYTILHTFTHTYWERRTSTTIPPIPCHVTCSLTCFL